MKYRFSKPGPAASETLKSLAPGTPEWAAAAEQALEEQPEMWLDGPKRKHRGWSLPSMSRPRASSAPEEGDPETDIQTTNKPSAGGELGEHIKDDEMAKVKTADAACNQCHTKFQYQKRGPARTLCDECRAAPRKRPKSAPKPAPVADPGQGNTVYDALSRGDLIAKLEQQAGTLADLRGQLETRTFALDRTEVALASAQKKVLRLSDHNTALQEAVDSLTTEVDEILAQRIHLQARRDSLLTEREELRAAYAALAVQLREAQAHIVLPPALEVDCPEAELVVERLGLLYKAGALPDSEYVKSVLAITCRQTGILMEMVP